MTDEPQPRRWPSNTELIELQVEDAISRLERTSGVSVVAFDVVTITVDHPTMGKLPAPFLILTGRGVDLTGVESRISGFEIIPEWGPEQHVIDDLVRRRLAGIDEHNQGVLAQRKSEAAMAKRRGNGHQPDGPQLQPGRRIILPGQ